MLQHIYIKNIGLISEVRIDFQRGLNVLTGETGAGKTIIIDALQLAIGGRAQAELMRSGAEKAIVEAAFDQEWSAGLVQLLAEQDIVLSPEDCLVLTREITRSGKNICRVNGQVVTLAFYRLVGTSLADLHMQHEQNTLLNQERHRELLDHFGGDELLNILEQVKKAYQTWQETSSRLARLKLEEEERKRHIDDLRHQIDELQQAGLQLGEEEDLIREKSVLVNAEKIVMLSDEAYRQLYDGTNGQPTATDLLAAAVDSLKNLVSYDSRVDKILALIENSLYQVEDAARELADYRDSVEYNPQRLEIVEERLNLLKTLQRKFGTDMPGLMQALDNAAAQLHNLLNVDEELAVLNREVELVTADYYHHAEQLSQARHKAAGLLEEGIAAELSFLEMGKVTFKIEFTPVTEPSPNGVEQVEFLISANQGEPLKPMAKIASGGELSRIMLALKSLLVKIDDKDVLVFDEVDTGIGGRALQAVAEKLSKLGEQCQVICVTHAPQVAAHAKAHYLISKGVEGNRTVTKVAFLDRESRLKELARMLGGKNITDITIQHADQMLKNSHIN
ncbi:MAG: DNA repair protein RecN [Peptococcaceae bacterium]|nr:DNA repair protein RecN [Peptococcaceae bacterium]